MMNGRRQHGQGMIELIISLGIIMASVVTTLGLVIATTTTSSASKAQILAANLAREGVEVVRSIRDSNWLAVDSGVANAAWNKSLSQGTLPDDYTAIAQFQPSISQWSLIYNADAIGDIQTPVYLHPVTGVYTQVDNQSELSCPGAFCSFVKTNYSRILWLNPVCWYRDPATGIELPTGANPERIIPNGNGATCTSAYGVDYVQVGVEVRSHVRWLEKGRPHNVEVVEKLFNWKA